MNGDIAIYPSRLFRVYLYLICLLVLVSVWATPLNIIVQVLLSLVLLLAFCVHLKQQGQQTQKSLSLREDGTVLWRTSEDVDYKTFTLIQATSLGAIVILRLKNTNNKLHHQLIMKDSLTETDWRALNRFLRGQWDR